MVQEDMLHDRIVCGINDNSIQKCLLLEPNVDFKKSVELVQSMETAEINQKDLRLPPTAVDMSPREPGSVDKAELINPQKSYLQQMWSLKTSSNTMFIQVSQVLRVQKDRSSLSGLQSKRKPHSCTVLLADEVAKEDAIQLYML